MHISFSHGGIYVLLRLRRGERDALGLVIKRRDNMMYSERYGGYRRAFAIGPLYFRTYARRPIIHTPA